MLKESSGFQGLKCLFKTEPLKPHGFAFIISDKPQFPEVLFALSWWFSLGEKQDLVSSAPLTKGRSALFKPQLSYLYIGMARESCLQSSLKGYETVFVQQTKVTVYSAGKRVTYIPLRFLPPQKLFYK